MSNPKFWFPWLFSKPNLSYTNSRYLSHSHKALIFFTLRTLLDSKWSWSQIQFSECSIGLKRMFFKVYHEIKFNFKKHAFETNWAFRKPSTKMQNAHTRKTAYTFFLYFTTDLQRKPNRRFFKTKLKQNRTRGFSQNRTELEKSIPHTPSLTCNDHRKQVGEKAVSSCRVINVM